MKHNNTEKIGYYVCALVDILGQKSKLNKLDTIVNIQTQHNEVLNTFRNTYGRVKKFRELISKSSVYFNSSSKHCNDSTKIKNSFFSDLIVSYLSLSNNGKEASKDEKALKYFSEAGV